MKSHYKIWIFALLGVTAIALFTFYLTTIDMVVMNPKGIVGLKQRDLLVTSTWLMLLVVIPVFAITFYVVWKYRAGNTTAKYKPNWDNNHIIKAIWWGLPTLIIIFLSILTWYSSHDLDPWQPLESNKKPIKIQVVALQWKWLFIYPEQGIATVNFFEFPENTPVHFDITSDAPMNSFWIPELGGQVYAMCGMKTQLQLSSQEKGSFRGVSANISGKGFAGMKFIAKASSDADFAAWVDQVKQSSNVMTMDEYKNLAKPSENNPVSYYTLQKIDLFDQVIMKYMMPMEK